MLYSPVAAVRLNPENPDHHLYNNNGVWWIHYTIYPTPVTKERVRKSLGTRAIEEARVLRDKQLAVLGVATPAEQHAPA